MVTFKNSTMYIIPPCDISRKFYQNPKKHLLGIFCNSNAEPKAIVDLNNLSLPPPVISLTEKKKLFSKKPNTSGSVISKSETINNVNTNNSNNSSLNENEIIELLTNLIKKNNEAEKSNLNISGK